MAKGIKKLLADPESRCSVMVACAGLAVLVSLIAAGFIWLRWDEVEDLGIRIGPNGWIGIALASLIVTILACGSGIWALREINKLTGRNSLKCTICCLLDALALAILVAFVIAAHSLKVGP